jgi:pimeloyl-ACP methyl ester carboxylesterase
MGGKTAMNFAVAHPDKLSKLIVVDIAPKYYDLEHYTIVKGLNAIPIESITSRNEADQLLAAYVPEPDVRQFLLKNLHRKPDNGFSWKINLPLITEQLSNIGVDLQFPGKFDKPTMFIRGRRSKYIQDADWTRISEVFPQATLETLETGHWVQAEKPQEFVELVMKWLQ